MNFKTFSTPKKKQSELFEAMLYPRKIEEKMLVLLRQGRISKWFSGIGQEAIAVGVTSALDQDEYVLPMHRNLGVFTTRGIPLHRLFAQFQGKREGFTKGRDRSFHFGTNEFNIVGMISHLGAQLAVADGISLAQKLGKTKKVTVAFSGEGGTSEGDFHESLNVAAVWKLPVIFIIENNGYGLSTPTSEQFMCKQLADKGIGYGMESHVIDGNNILEVYETIKSLKKEIQKNPRPVLVECMTFRMRGHEEASGTKYVPKEIMEEWGKKDPIVNFQSHLVEHKIITQAKIDKLHKSYKGKIEKELGMAFDMAEIDTSERKEEEIDVYRSYQPKVIAPNLNDVEDMRLIDAISNGLYQAMEHHANLLIMGQDIAEYGGVFKITDGFVKAFGKERVRNTPICESAIVGAALGLSIAGQKSIVEMQFGDFVTCAFNQIVNNVSKSHYRWNQNADVVIRMPTGGGMSAGPFHSQSNEAWFFHSPGLKIVYPSNPVDAKGLLLAAIDDPNPVMYFEHKALYRKISAAVPKDYYTVPIGKAIAVQEGEDVTIITYGMGVHWAQEVAAQMKDVSMEIVDLRTLQPLDTEMIYDAVKKTGKTIVLHEDSLTGGIGGEIAALIAEHCFEHLDAPVVRCGSMDTPIPFAATLEEQYLAVALLKNKIEALMAY